MAIKVLLADDSDVVRMAIRRTLEEDARIEVVGEASTFAETMQLLASKPRPQVSFRAPLRAPFPLRSALSRANATCLPF